MLLPRPTRQRRCGTVNNVSTASCDSPNLPNTGIIRWKQSSLFHINYGSWWTIYLVEVVRLRDQLLTLRSSVDFFADKVSEVQSSTAESSSADPVPTSVLKQIANIIATFIVELFNSSLHKGFFPTRKLMLAYLEHLVALQLMNYLTLADLLPPLQSGFRRVILLKLLFCECSVIFSRLLTMVT